MIELSYFAADTLNVTLYQIKDQLMAKEVHPMTMGPWRIDLQVDVVSDVLSSTGLGFWVTLATSIRLYVIVKEKVCWLFVLDPTRLSTLSSRPAVGDDLKRRVSELKPAITAVFRWKPDNLDGWNRIEPVSTPSAV